MSFEEFMSKVKEGAEIAVDAAGQALSGAKKSVDKTLEVSALNTKIKHVNQRINDEFMAIGRLVYDTHKDPETSSEGLQEKLEHIDELYAELSDVKAERDRRQAE